MSRIIRYGSAADTLDAHEKQGELLDECGALVHIIPQYGATQAEARAQWVAAVGRAVGVRRLLDDGRLLEIMGGVGSLPKPPEVYQELVAAVSDRLTGIEVWHNPKRSLVADGAVDRTFEGINPNHWWLVGTVQAAANSS